MTVVEEMLVAQCSMRRRAVGFVAMALLLASCGSDERTAESESASPDPSVGSGSTQLATGTWTVVGHYIPGISAMSDTEAATHHGELVRLTEGEAASSGERCDAPTYSTRTVQADRFIAEEFRLPSESLPALQGTEEMTVIEVSCGGSHWGAMGALLLVISPNRALAPWDGVFFDLRREP